MASYPPQFSVPFSISHSSPSLLAIHSRTSPFTGNTFLTITRSIHPCNPFCCIEFPSLCLLITLYHSSFSLSLSAAESLPIFAGIFTTCVKEPQNLRIALQDSGKQFHSLLALRSFLFSTTIHDRSDTNLTFAL